jgi:hypothetical protein
MSAGARSLSHCPTGRRSTAVTQAFTVGKPSTGGGGNPPPIVVDTTPPNVRVTVRFLRATRNGLVKLRIYCPATEVRCRVTLRIKQGDRVLAQKTLTVKGGKKRTFVLKLSKPTLRTLIQKGRVKATVRVTARDAANNTKRTSKRITLLRPKHR